MQKITSVIIQYTDRQVPIYCTRVYKGHLKRSEALERATKALTASGVFYGRDYIILDVRQSGILVS